MNIINPLQLHCFMKKTIIALMAFAITLGAAAQQQRRNFTPEQSATMQTDRIKEACNIDETQYKAIYALYINQSKRMEAFRDSIRNAGGDMRQGMSSFMKEYTLTNDSIKLILNDEQKAAFDKLQQERRNRQGGFGRGGNGGPRGNGQRRNRD